MSVWRADTELPQSSNDKKKGRDETLGTTTDNDADFTDDFCGFLQRCVTSVDAAELLLVLFEHAERSWSARELSTHLAPMANVSEGDVERHLDVLQQSAIVARDTERSARYRSAAAHDAHVATLARLYVERPVTLFRVIYALRDKKINTFAEAFRLRR